MFLGWDQNLQVWKAVKAHELEASDWFNDNVSKLAAKKKGCAFTSAGVVSAFHVKVMSGSQISQCQELNGCVFTKRQWKWIPFTEWEPCDSDAEKKGWEHNTCSKSSLFFLLLLLLLFINFSRFCDVILLNCTFHWLFATTEFRQPGPGFLQCPTVGPGLQLLVQELVVLRLLVPLHFGK